MPEQTLDQYRPIESERWGNQIGRDQEPVQIHVRTKWYYNDNSPDRKGDACVCCPGRHAFSRAGMVVSSDTRTPFSDISGHLWAAIREFGDDADLIIEVRRA